MGWVVFVLVSFGGILGYWIRGWVDKRRAKKKEEMDKEK